jgi:acyl-CoA synthetase (NDP forming)
MTESRQEAPPAALGRGLIDAAVRSGADSLDEAAAKQLFSLYGVPVSPGAVAATVEDAVREASRVGFPVVMKGATGRVQHKTEAGLVLLGVADEEAVRHAFRALTERAAAAGVGPLDGVLVERMITGKREFVVGMTRDLLFGPVIMFGLGGILTEALHDVAFAVAPLEEADAAELLDQIKGKVLLDAFRGAPAVDRHQLVKVIQAVSQMAADHPEIREIDINPLLIDGSQPVAVDALVSLGPPVTPSTRAPADESELHALVAPRSVAVVGASADSSKWGGMVVANLLLGGFDGPIYPVNPKGGTILGLPVFPTVDALPEVPDLVLVTVPASLVEQVVDECGRKGVSAVVVVSAGFSELGAEGRALEDRVVDAAARHGMALVGPNCMGVISAHHRLYATGFMVLRPDPGGASFVSQSGNLGTQLLAAAERRKGGIGKFIGVGNEAMIDAVDFIHYLGRDPETSVIVAYMEGFDDGRRLLEVTRATSLKKPVVVLRGGMSAYGQKAAASHTGAMASSAAVFGAAARQSGMIVTTDPDEFMDLTFALSYLPLPRGKRVAVLTMGGGWGVLVADEVARSGLELAELGPDVVETLNGVLPAFWSHGNPVDLVATVTAGVPEAALEAVVASPDVDAVIVLGVVGSLAESRHASEEIERLKMAHTGDPSGRGTNADALAREADGVGVEPELSEREVAFLERSSVLMQEHCKPIVSVAIKPLDKSVFSGAGRFSALVLPSPLRAVRVVGKMADYSGYLKKKGREAPC